MTAAVTFVVPARNSADTIANTLASVARQTRGDWQVIVVVDSSTDDTRRIAGTFLADRRFQIMAAECGSAAAARNLGGRAASTPWLVFLDSDDLIDPDYLGEMLGRAEGGGAAGLTAVYCSGQKMTGDGRLGHIERPPQRDHLYHLRSRNIFYTHAVMVSRQAFQALGGFRASLTICEDWEFWLRLFQAGAVVAEVDRALTTYCMRPGSLVKHPQLVLGCASGVIRRALAYARRALPRAETAGRMALLNEARTFSFCLALWAMGLSLDGGKIDRTLLRHVAPADAVEPERLAVYFIDGSVRGACLLWEDWPVLWAQHRAEIHGMIACLSSSFPAMIDWAGFGGRLADYANPSG